MIIYRLNMYSHALSSSLGTSTEHKLRTSAEWDNSGTVGVFALGIMNRATVALSPPPSGYFRVKIKRIVFPTTVNRN